MPDLITLARRKAAEHQLAPELVCALCEHESNWNPWAAGFVPAFFAGRVAPEWFATGRAWTVTEVYHRATRWGLMQLTGQAAREHGFQGAFLSELCDPVAGLELGCRVLGAALAAAGGDLRGALLLWHASASGDSARAGFTLAGAAATARDPSAPLSASQGPARTDYPALVMARMPRYTPEAEAVRAARHDTLRRRS